MMGFKVGSKFICVKKCHAPTDEEVAAQLEREPLENEVFKQIIEEKPTPCLVLKNLVSLQEHHEVEDFKELEFDVQDEMSRYGKVVRTHVPRPPKFGDPF